VVLDIHLELTEDAYRGFEEQLAPLGISVRDTGRSTVEDFERDCVDMVMVSGVITYRGCDFHFHRQKDRKGCHLWILVGDQEADDLCALVDVLEKTFPQPPQRFIPAPRPWTVGRVLQILGCSLALAVFGAVCLLSTLGLWTLLQWL
jgi:hypothetical protein